MTEHKCSSAFRYAGKTVTVTLTDPYVSPDGTEWTLGPRHTWVQPEPNGQLPVPTSGAWIDGTYSVTGLEHDLTVTTTWAEWDDAQGMWGIQIDTMTVHWDSGHVQTDAFSIPTRQLRIALSKAAHIRGLWIPPGASWQSTDGETVTETDPDGPGSFWITGFGPPTAAEQAQADYLAGLVGLPRKPRANTDQLDAEIEQVAAIWHDTTYGNRVAEIAREMHLSPSLVRNRIRQARDRGLIPEVTDGRSRQNRSKR
jgi:hypothetical protein